MSYGVRQVEGGEQAHQDSTDSFRASSCPPCYLIDIQCHKELTNVNLREIYFVSVVAVCQVLGIQLVSHGLQGVSVMERFLPFLLPL